MKCTYVYARFVIGFSLFLSLFLPYTLNLGTPWVMAFPEKVRTLVRTLCLINVLVSQNFTVRWATCGTNTPGVGGFLEIYTNGLCLPDFPPKNSVIIYGKLGGFFCLCLTRN